MADLDKRLAAQYPDPSPLTIEALKQIQTFHQMIPPWEKRPNKHARRFYDLSIDSRRADSADREKLAAHLGYLEDEVWKSPLEASSKKIMTPIAPSNNDSYHGIFFSFKYKNFRI